MKLNHAILKTKLILSKLLLFSLIILLASGCKKEPKTDPTTPPLELEQIEWPGVMMTLSAISYIADMHDTTAIRDSIDTLLLNTSLATGGHWKRVWGPAVSGEKSNMVFVAMMKTSTVPVYAIVIRGTNIASLDGILQDLRVFSLDWFHYGEPDDSVSKGAMQGFDSLMLASSGGMNLQTYLSGLSYTQTIPLFVTGHSQGGSLAPLMAYWLVRNQSFAGKFEYHTLAFAGPGVVNEKFKEHLTGALSSAGGTFQMRVNTKDVIPYFWSDLPGIMTENVPVSVPGLYKLLFHWALDTLQVHQIKYVNINTAIPIGFIPITDIGTIHPSDTIKWYDHWLAVEHNHNNYLKLLGVPVIP